MRQPFAVLLLGLLAVGLSAQPPEAPAEKPEPLPPVPKLDPKSEMKALLPDKSLYLEKAPDGKRRVLFSAEVCLSRGPLELFLCKKGTKEHEAIVRIGYDARFLHAALEAAGAKAGKPVQFVNPKTMEEEYKPASGTPITVTVHYTKDGKTHTHAAQEWITDRKTKKPMDHKWVFAGSQFYKTPDRPGQPDYYGANNGDVISISNFPDAALELPVQIGRDDALLNFEANGDKIPPLGSQVWVILAAAEEKPK